MHQDCGFDPRSGHIQKSTNEYISKWNNRLIVSLFLSLPLSLLKINKLVILKEYLVSRSTVHLIKLNFAIKFETSSKLCGGDYFIYNTETPLKGVYKSSCTLWRSSKI